MIFAIIIIDIDINDTEIIVIFSGIPCAVEKSIKSKKPYRIPSKIVGIANDNSKNRNIVQPFLTMFSLILSSINITRFRDLSTFFFTNDFFC